MRLMHNMQSLSILKGYDNNLAKNATALERISSGLKINSAKDNPVKLGQSENLRMQIKSLQAASKNLQDGVSMIQTADSAMSSVADGLNRMKELSVQAATGTYTEEDREIIQKEIDQLKKHIDQTAENTEFNGIKMIKDEDVWNNEIPSNKYMQAGANIDEQIMIPMFNVSTEVLKISDVSVETPEKVQESIATLDEALVSVNKVRSKYGAIQQRLETSAENLNQNKTGIEKASSNITDANIALEMIEFTKTTILRDTSTAILQQTNNFPKDVLRILENIK